VALKVAWTPWNEPLLHGHRTARINAAALPATAIILCDQNAFGKATGLDLGMIALLSAVVTRLVRVTL
jgi:hypothetical protein